MFTRIGTAIAIVLICCLSASVSAADVSTGFEEWLGHNAEAIGSSIYGLSFGSTANTDAFFADINAQVPGNYDWYSLTSDNGKMSGDGEYFMSGNMAAYVLDGNMKISVTGGCAKDFTVGVSSFFDVFLEAYDATGTLIGGPTGIASGGPNTKTQPLANPGTGLQYLTVSSPTTNIAYVVVRTEPGFSVVDNVSYSTVPEPVSMLTLAMGVVGLAGIMRRRAS